MTDPSDRSGRFQPVVAALLIAMAMVGAWDLFTDSPRVWRRAHGLVELASIVLALATALLLWRGWRGAERSLAGMRRSLEAHRAERDHWQALARNVLRGLGEALDAQFDVWSLTPAEKEIALLLLKGYSHKETASLTQRSERTVRQHAVSVYRKSGLSGRAELAAFFFEDMLLPATPAGSASTAQDHPPRG